ncbi:MAG: hypothetical protein HYR94_01445 [Chloroflexi bacterium]|nr:hypothetical protein [Chloroflexota bacterium]
MNTLYEQITGWDNLHLAYKKAAKGKRGKGPAARFEYRLEDNLAALQRELLDKTYQPGQYTPPRLLPLDCQIQRFMARIWQSGLSKAVK